MKYGSVPGVEKPVARIVQGTVMIRSQEEEELTVPQVALAYVLDQPLEIFALVGCNTGEEFASNVEAGAVELSPEELAWLESGDPSGEGVRTSSA